jgi:hypothetical protein
MDEMYGVKCIEASFLKILKTKSTVYYLTRHERTSAWYRYTFSLSLTLVLDGGGWSMLRPE